MTTAEMTAWISAASIATAAVVGLVNLIVMGWLTAAIRRHGRDTAAHDVLRRNSEQWQALNLAFINQPRLQSLLDGIDLVSGDERQAHRNIIFYILNTLHDLFMAKEAGLISGQVAGSLMAGQLGALIPHAAEIRMLFAAQTGYSPQFCRAIEASLP